MKFLTHPAVTALGLAYLCLIGLASPLVSPTHSHIYHLSGSASTVFVPVILYLFLLWLLLGGLLAFVNRHPRIRIVVWSAIIFFGPWVLFRNYLKFMGEIVAPRLNLIIFAFSLVGFIIFLCSWRPAFRFSFERLQRVLTVLFGFASLTGVLLIGQLLWFNWQARSLNTPLPLHQQNSYKGSGKPRVLWILMDELSYQQVYEQRFPGLNLPAFDQLASDSTVFTHVVPAGNVTEVVIPSILTGSPVDQVSSSSDGRTLTLHNPVTDTSQVFDAHQTVFKDALQNGYSTAIVGWYNPYCRALHEVLDRCFWTNHMLVSGSIGDQQSITENLLAPLERLVASVPSLFHPDPGAGSRDLLEAQRHIVDVQLLSSKADQMIGDPTADFLFLHMPIPHPPGIYDRHLATFTTRHSSYIDNLALTDHFIAHIRKTLEQEGQWDSSTIIIMGDHSWRTSLWASFGLWTPEDMVASHGGQFDDRPAYIVKLPNQQKPTRIDDRFEAVRTRALLDGIITNRIKTPEDLAAWVRQQN
jgi:Sulfatase